MTNSIWHPISFRRAVRPRRLGAPFLKQRAAVFAALAGASIWLCAPPAPGDDAVADPDAGMALVDERHEHSGPPETPRPQRPELSTPENVDTGRSIFDWQHLTDDWGGLRPGLDDRGLTFEASATMDGSANFSGGLSSLDKYNGLIDEVAIWTQALTADQIAALAAGGRPVAALVCDAQPGEPAADDATCDGIDDDCDGEIDEDADPCD